MRIESKKTQRPLFSCDIVTDKSIRIRILKEKNSQRKDVDYVFIFKTGKTGEPKSKKNISNRSEKAYGYETGYTYNRRKK